MRQKKPQQAQRSEPGPPSCRLTPPRGAAVPPGVVGDRISQIYRQTSAMRVLQLPQPLVCLSCAVEIKLWSVSVVAGAPGQAYLAGVGPAEGPAPDIVSKYHGREPQPILEQLDHQLATKRLGASAAGFHPSPPPNNAGSAQRTWCSEPAVSALVLYIAMPLKWGQRRL